MKRRGIMALVLTLILLAGCSKAPASVTEDPTTVPTTMAAEPVMDVQTLTEKMIAAAEKYSVTQLQVKQVMDMQVSMSGIGMSMNMSQEMTAKIKSSEEQQRSYTEMTMKMDMLGQQTKETSQIYLLMEDGSWVSYTHTDSTGAWTRDESPEVTDRNMTDFLAGMSAESLALEETQQYVGRDVYVLRGTASADMLNMDSTGLEEFMGTGSFENFDLSQVEVPVTLYVDQDLFLLQKVEMDLSGMGEMMNSVIGSLMEGMGQNGTMAADISFDTYTLIASDFGYGPVAVPQLPEEAREWAQMGYYPIEEAEVSLRVPCPRGYYYCEGDYYYAGFVNEEMTHYLYYSLYTEEEFQEFYGKGDEEDIALALEFQQHGTGPEMIGFQTFWGVSDGVNCYFAWIQVGSCKLVVESYDWMEGSSLEGTLTELLEALDAGAETL